jgi:hypothetical protein
VDSSPRGPLTRATHPRSYTMADKRGPTVNPLSPLHLRAATPVLRGGHSGYPKISGRVIRVFRISGFENRYPKLQRVLQYPKIRVPEISGSGSGIPELPELLCRLHKNA